MASLNNCMFIGNVGKIETRYMTNGEAVTNISLAVNETWKSKDGEKHERVEWVRCVIYRKLAEVAEKWVKKGDPLYISGKLQTKKWQDKDTGADRYTTEIIVNEMQMLGGKREQGDQQAAPQSKPAPSDNFDSDAPF